MSLVILLKLVQFSKDIPWKNDFEMHKTCFRNKSILSENEAKLLEDIQVAEARIISGLIKNEVLQNS